MIEKLTKEFEKIRVSLTKSKKIILADIDKIDEKYRKLAQEEKKSLTEGLSVLNEQLKYYDNMLKGVKIEEEAPAEEAAEEEEEETVKDTLFPDNNEENEEEPKETEKVAEVTGLPDGAPASDNPVSDTESDDIPDGTPVADPATEEDEWQVVSNEDPVDSSAEGWGPMPEEWK